MATFFFLLTFLGASASYNQHILHKMKWINFTFQNSSDWNTYNLNKHYRSCMPAGVKVSSNGTIFVGIPRWWNDVPATLNVLINSKDNIGLFQPFPSFEGNKAYDPSALQAVLGFEIDKHDNIWALDQGLINGSYVPGSAKLNKYKITGELLMSWNLEKFIDPIHPEYSFLNDLVIDTENDFIYISDSGYRYPGFIVIDLNTNEIWRTMTLKSSTIPDPTLWIVINGKRVNENNPMQTGVDGIALSCDRRILYYTPLTSRTLYAIETKYLREAKNNKDISNKAVKLGYKKSASDGLLSGAKGRLYITAIELNGVLKVNDINPNPTDFHYADFHHVISDDKAVWPDTLGFNNQKRQLLAMCNQLQNFVAGAINYENPVNGDANFYLWAADVDDYTYQEGCDFSSGDYVGQGFPTWAILLLIISLFILLGIVFSVVRYFIISRRKRQSLISR